jgi:hypothetical protein
VKISVSLPVFSITIIREPPIRHALCTSVDRFHVRRFAAKWRFWRRLSRCKQFRVQITKTASTSVFRSADQLLRFVPAVF